MSCRQHGYPRPSLATSPYHSSPPAGLQGYILCPHIVAVCKFVLVVLLLHIHMWGSLLLQQCPLLTFVNIYSYMIYKYPYIFIYIYIYLLSSINQSFMSS